MKSAFNLDAYRQDLFRPVDHERCEAQLEVIGELPEALDGLFCQNNPNPALPPEPPYHWFDGDGMVHAVRLQGGRASYRNRWVRTSGLARDRAAGRATTRGILHRFDPSDPAPDKDTANTDLVWHEGKLLALWWLGGQPYALDPESLDTLGPETFGGTLGMGVAAHPKVDPRTSELVFMDYSLYDEPRLSVGVVHGGRLVHQHVEPLAAPKLLHDLAITEHYNVLLDFPMVWRTDKLAQGIRHVRFHDDQPARIGVMERRGTSVRWFEIPPCYCYHTVNAWEEGDEIVLVACRIENPVPRLPHPEDAEIPRLTFLRLEPYLWRWRIDLVTGQVREEQLDDCVGEFPRMDDARLGAPSRFAYLPRFAKHPRLQFEGLRKIDHEGTERVDHRWGPGRFGSEPAFVPRPGAVDEDDGWVVALVHDEREARSELCVLEAQDFGAAPVARVLLPRVPVGFHTRWVPGSEL